MVEIMINSRSIKDLLPIVQNKVKHLIQESKNKGIDLIITSTYRDHMSQQVLYNQGRTIPGKIVTNAKPGYSYHNWKCAFDVVPIINGKAIWNDTILWNNIGELGESCGLEWAGRWKNFKELAHFQYTGGLSIFDLIAGKTIK